MQWYRDDVDHTKPQQNSLRVLPSPENYQYFRCLDCGHEQKERMTECPKCHSDADRIKPMNRAVSQPQQTIREESRDITEIMGADPPRFQLGMPEIDRALGGGLVDASRILITGEPGIGKCCTGDTLVIDPRTGARYRLDALIASRPQGATVLAMDPSTMRLVPAQISEYHDNGERPVFELRTVIGRRLRATANHPLWTPTGWKALSELKPGEHIAAPRALPYFGSATLSEPTLKFMAYYLGDGRSDRAIEIGTAEDPIHNDLSKIASAFGCALSSRSIRGSASRRCRFINATNPILSDGPTRLRWLLKDWGLEGVRSHEKAIPASAFELTRDCLRILMRALVSADGSVYVDKRLQPGLSFNSCSEALARGVQHLMLRLGFVARLRKKPGKRRKTGTARPGYEVTLRGLESVQRWLKEVGMEGRVRAQQRILRMVPSDRFGESGDVLMVGDDFWLRARQANALVGDGRRLRARIGFQERSPGGWISRQKLHALQQVLPMNDVESLLASGIYWDRVASITDAGVERVYDITVPGPASFVANDLIVHNSTLFLQIAAAVAREHGKKNACSVLYATGEEDEQAIGSRARRLDQSVRGLRVVATSLLSTVERQARRWRPKLLVVDSVGTFAPKDDETIQGTVKQVRTVLERLSALRTELQMTLLLIVHINKEGVASGPKYLEHMVDVYGEFRGDRTSPIRRLIFPKNRHGQSGEAVVLEMTKKGLREVAEPQQQMLMERSTDEPGAVVFASAENDRPALMEIAVMVSGESAYDEEKHIIQRPPTISSAEGLPMSRMNKLLTLLCSAEERLWGTRVDAELTCATQTEVQEAASDLPIAAAILSSSRGLVIPSDVVMFGMVSVTGRLKPAQRSVARLEEALRCGFTRALIAPDVNLRDKIPPGMAVEFLPVLHDLGFWIDKNCQKPGPRRFVEQPPFKPAEGDVAPPPEPAEAPAGVPASLAEPGTTE